MTLQTVIPSYIYEQFNDDLNVTSFFSSYNQIAQGYLDWANQNPLSVYTNQNISGQFLDWIATGIYGISRPVILTPTVSGGGAFATVPYGLIPFAGIKTISAGTVSYASDDIYKRVLTWHLYVGDGRQMSVEWLRRRVTRFLYGASGTDFPSGINQAMISLTQMQDDLGGTLLTDSGFPVLISTSQVRPYLSLIETVGITASAGTVTIKVPASNAVSTTFQLLMAQNILPVPFQTPITVQVV